MSFVQVSNLLASLVCDRVAIDMILKEEGVSENVREHVREMITGRIDNVKENKVTVDDIIRETVPDLAAIEKAFKAGYVESYRDTSLQHAKFYNRPVKNRDVYNPFEGDVEKAWDIYAESILT